MLHKFAIRNHDATVRADHPIDGCIYCGSTEYEQCGVRELGEEHVIPEGLGGTLAVRLASCGACEAAINQFEQPILKTILYAPRVHLGIRRKQRKRKNMELFRLSGTVNGRDVEFYLPLNEIPVVLLFLLQFGPPGVLIGRPADMGHMNGTWVLNLSGNWGAFRQRGMQAMTSPVANVDHFCRFLAKIAHGYATAILGHSFKPGLTEFIRTGVTIGRNYFIGGSLINSPPSENLHELAVDWSHVEGTDYAVVRIRLFANLGAPVYSVVVGERQAATGWREQESPIQDRKRR